jgi:propionyl-CoA synthetase
VEKLPKTRTGKYLRNIVRKMYNKEKYQLPSTIDDHSVAEDLQNFINKVHAEQKD